MGGFVDWSGVYIFRRLIVDIGQLVINMSNKLLYVNTFNMNAACPLSTFTEHIHINVAIVNTLSTLIYMRLVVLPSNTNRWLQKNK